MVGRLQSDGRSSQFYSVHSAKSTNHSIDRNNHSDNYLSCKKKKKKKKWGISKMKKSFIWDNVSTAYVCSKCICFFRKLKRLWLIGNRTSCLLIPFVIILVTDNSHSDFVNHSFDYRPNWTPLGHISIIDCVNAKLIQDTTHWKF